MKDFLFDISSINFHREDRGEILAAFRAKAAELGINFGVQLHNDENKETIDFLKANNVPLSGHSPLLEKYNWNFAAEDISPVSIQVEDIRIEVTDLQFHFLTLSIPLKNIVIFL